MRIVLDSSVIISLLNQNDTFHHDTTEFMKILSTDEAVVIIAPTLVFLEVANILYQKVERFREQTLVEAFNNFEIVNLDYDFAKQILPVLKNLNLKTSDAIICATAKLTDSILITWDEKLNQRANKIIRTANPHNFL